MRATHENAYIRSPHPRLITSPNITAHAQELLLNRDRDAAAITGATRTAFARLWAHALDGEEDLANRALDRLFHLFFGQIHDRLDPALLADVQHLPKKVTPKGALRVVARFAEVQGDAAYPVYKVSHSPS